jgi:hypothetical protein
MTSFSSYFGITKTQAELSFVDIDLTLDTPLYIDPYALTTSDDEWSIQCHQLVVSYFETILLAIKNNDNVKGTRLLSHLGEPEETRLGVSQPGNKGRGIGHHQAAEMFKALKDSKAAKSGLLEDLSDFALFIRFIGRDKISDMTTNIIRGALITYTQTQCELLGIPMRNVTSGFYWDIAAQDWRQSYVNLPICNEKKVILVPKYTVRYQVSVDHAVFRSKFVLEFLQEEHTRPGDSLLTTIKNKKGQIIREQVYIKDVDAHYPKSKDFLADFASKHPDVIDSYRDSLKVATSKVPNISRDTINEADLANHLISQLKLITSGASTADVYHSLMIGIISFLFFPNLINPKKEAPINEGRKRIDITFINGKVNGFFYRIALDGDIKANLVHAECKNYTNDIANPEFDQLIGRFDHNRGKLGMLFYRASDKPETVVSRCRDAAKSAQGIILPIDDAFVIKCLNLVATNRRSFIDKEITDLYQLVIS